jgi:MFS transporter, DHA2 family, multidrug resistance protein
MIVEVAPPPAGHGRRTIVAAAFMTTYMQALNISVPNAALPHMQGTLSMADDEVGWIFNAYIAAGAVVMPMSSWLAARYGRKKVLLFSLAVFAIGLILDTLATTPLQIVLARVVQGAASGPLIPLSAAILLDTSPPTSHAKINLTNTICLLLGISSGPAIGGWFSEYCGWPSIFYLSLPLTAFIFLVVALSLEEKRSDQKSPFDFFALATFSLGLVGLQMLLDRGERLEWFDSSEIWIEALTSALGFYLFTVHALTTKEHFVRSALFKDRNFILSTIMSFALGFVLLPTLALTSPMLEGLLDYPVDTTGYMAIPRGAALAGSVALMSFVPARIGPRVFLLAGAGLVVYANWLMLGYSPDMDWRPVVRAGVLQGAGLGIVISSLGRTVFSTLPAALRPQGGALFNISRLYGNTIGIATVQIFFYNNTQAVHLALAKDLAPFHASAHISSPIAVPGLAMLNGIVTRQAAVIAVVDQFKILMFAMLIVTPLALFLRKAAPIALSK